MKSVIDHRYAKRQKTPIYGEANGDVLGHLPASAWIGILEVVGSWARVISAEIDGWVQLSDTVDGEDFKLSIVPPATPTQPVIQYALSA